MAETLKNLCDASACDGVAPEPLTRVASIPVGRIRAGEIGRVLPRLWGFHSFPRVPSPFHHRSRPAATLFRSRPPVFSRPPTPLVRFTHGVTTSSPPPPRRRSRGPAAPGVAAKQYALPEAYPAADQSFYGGPKPQITTECIGFQPRTFHHVFLHCLSTVSCARRPGSPRSASRRQAAGVNPAARHDPNGSGWRLKP